MARLTPRQKRQLIEQPRKLLIVCAIAAVVLTVSTYAWFIGMRTVNVTSFDVEIATTDSLLLSLDGESWATEVTMNQDMIQEVSYDEHTNRWSKLVPISTIGQMNATSSRMILYEKASYTATPGGYRLMAAQIDNAGATERDGYVAFDLFIKNFSGSQYIQELNQLDEEAIYLTTDSEVVVSSNGVLNTGIENSVRVAFAPIGRVNGAITDTTTITGISCNGAAGTIVDEVTSICRTDRIWEPNNKSHVANAIKWYNASCLSRKVTGTDVTNPDSYDKTKPCGQILNDNYYPTYAIGGQIRSSDNVDVYDGAEYNGYTGTPNSLLVKYPYFTDEDKMKKGIARPYFMYLAPNSTTKVRVYIYLEGQDIDNYDFAQIGKKISVRFGFTKERFEQDDINYDGPPIDTTLPVIKLNGDNPVRITVGTSYVDAGATALDEVDGDLTDDIDVDSNVNTAVKGTYRVTYSVTDKAGNKAIRSRYVVVE